MVSPTAAALVAASPAIADAHFRAEAYPYHPELRPDGYLNLGTAENRLVGDLITERLSRPHVFTEAETRYAELHGTPVLRERVAELLTRTGNSPVDPENLVVVSGATAALDIIASVLCHRGDAIVVPAPYYAAFDTDLGGRSGARVVPAPMDASNGFALCAQAVDRTITGLTRQGVTVRAVALASPSNPLGQVHSAEQLRELAEVAAAHDVDLIGDELYSHSVFGPTPYTSLRDPAVGRARAGRTHTIWGFAKDFGLPGFKTGVLHVTDPQVREAARTLAYFAPVSTGTQALLADLLAEPEWTADYLAESRRRQAASYEATASALAQHGIRHLPAEAGCSLWLDLREHLPEPTYDGERRLWQTILSEARVSIIPGEVFHPDGPGWFRLCHTQDQAVVAEAVARLGKLLGSGPTAGPSREVPA
ncbi:aminotransferase class I/II-fold pyridoxal phosphate-dependent enzyme [Kitasatospora sp. GP82]|uniref:aminotransferase class I/II-fold pyridoxal phosphate-dependent enzyme n=1 Tax=Kitasatospora sp. GP82 TaxID=3035089 RepID=UPI0024741D09|nr:aminotransferase class I/II-fold pyridoxal phosphate-dependent enzyme [Kitasatospora sp. GP82]MDH6128869.1 aspartate/methionine/tyrosine aminotransferase [Kitasatospora sp. GP82]